MCRCILVLSLLVICSCTRDNGGLGDDDMGVADATQPSPDLMCGGPEICGDGIDNNCNMMADEGCNGLGTFVSNTGNDANPGTQMMPVATIKKGIDNAKTIGGGADVFVAGGHYSEKVTLVEGISLFGGYECNAQSCTWARDAVKNDTAILNTDAEGVLADRTITRKTLIDGFRVAGAAANGGITAALTIDGGSPTVSNNRLFGGTHTGMGGGTLTTAIRVYLPSNDPMGALIDQNEVTGGMATDTTAAISVAGRGATTGPAVVVISNNVVVGGNGRNTTAIAAGPTSAGSLIKGNRVTAGSATTGLSYGLALAGELLVDGNMINTDGAKVGSCTGNSGGWCAGIVSFSSKATINNNVVYGVSGGPRSAAVSLLEAEVPAGVAIVNGNYLDGGGGATPGIGTQSMSTAVVLRIGACNTCGFNGVFGRLRNNILAGGQALQRFGVVEDNAPGKTNVPEALENNLFYFAPATASVDTLYRQWNGAINNDIKTLMQVNMLTKPPAAANLAGDPLLDSTWHLKMGSPCANAGTKTEAPADDRDGDTRPKGAAIDIGPDEAN